MARAAHSVIHLSDMHKPEADYYNLLIGTGEALDRQALKLLLLSVQRNNVEFCIEQVIKE
jgi:hypothetical protein